MSKFSPERLAKANQRARMLLENMTLDEKIWQMVFVASIPLEGDHFSPEKAEKYKNGVGGLMIPNHLPPEKIAAWVNDAQSWFKNNTRLGIPPVIFCESLHGVMTHGATVFPQAIALGSSFDTELVEEIALAIGKEARSMGISQSLAPDLDLARDPRWGRVEETYGEDSYLTGELGAAYVRGLQSEEKGLENSAYTATLKHFCAHGSPEGGVNLAPVYFSEREVRDKYLPPFARALEEGALSVMPAYSELDGVPAHSNYMLLTKMLRDELHFEGFTFSDFGGIDMVQSMHHCARDLDEAAVQVLKAGMDTEAPSRYAFGDNLMRMVQDGTLDVALIDRSVLRILRVKDLLNLFDDPYSQPQLARSLVHNQQHLALARKAAAESCVLLKNDGVLPLQNIRDLAVIGPNADCQETGDYTRDRTNVVTLLQALKQRKDLHIHYAPGCDIWSPDQSGFAAARDAVLASDAAVIVVGGRSYKQYGMGWGDETDDVITCGEGFDYHDLKLSGVQEELVLEMAALGKPVVMVLIDGRPSTIGKAVAKVNALLCAWYPGEQGGYALCDVLFGDQNPCGKLPITFPKSVGQVPLCYDHKPSGRGFYHRPGSPENPGRDYVFSDTKPLFDFGEGLSYTTFEYSNLELPASIAYGQDCPVSIQVTNTGDRAGKEAVLLFIRDQVSTLTTPVRRLRRFEKIHLAPGESRTVHFTLTKEDMTFVGLDMQNVLESGEFTVMIGSQTGEFTVLPPAK